MKTQKMKAKLIKTDVNYLLEDDKGVVVASTSTKEGNSKLSKQNCDEIFGVIDVEELAKNYLDSRHDNEDIAHPELYEEYGSFVKGFNRATELNKDRVFTIDDIDKAIEWATVNGRNGDITHYDIDNFIQSLQQPTEIEVEIEMRNSRTGNIVKHDSDLEWDENGLCDRAIPKLDSEGCLILKKI
jgi:hypothetical protein